MGLSSGTIDKIIGLAGSAAGLAFGPPATAAASGLVTIRSWLADRTGGNPENAAVLTRLRDRVRGDHETWLASEGDWARRADLAAADAALGATLGALLLDRAALAACSRHADGFVPAAGTLILDRLAAANPLFAPGDAAPVARDYAAVILRLALTAAVDDKAWFAAIEPHLLFDMAEGVGAANTKLDQQATKLEAIIAMLGGTGSDGLLRARAAELLRLNPAATGDEIEASLRAALIERDALKAELDALRAEDNRIAGLVGAAEAAIDDGRFEAARELLDQASAVHEERELAARTARAGLTAAKARVARLRIDYADAVRLWDEADGLATDADAASDYRWQAADAAQEWGERFGEPTALPDAVRRWQAMASPDLRERDPRQWSGFQNNLGNALRTLGARQDDGAALADAVAAYEAALTVRTRAALPLDWAATQNNLGNALQTLGERQDDGAALADAVAAYEAALTVRTRAALPLDWAATQNNLGSALTTLGARQDDGAALAGAVAAYEAALTVRTREALPLDWAATQNNLGNALQTLGARQDDGAALADAVAAYQAALTVYTSEALPLDWAMTQNNLGNALRTLGARQDDGSALADAVAAYKAALTVRTREALPLDWAMTQNNLGNALWTLGERQDDGAALADAVAAYEAALTIFANPSLTFYRQQTDANLALARAAMERRRG